MGLSYCTFLKAIKGRLFVVVVIQGMDPDLGAIGGTHAAVGEGAQDGADARGDTLLALTHSSHGLKHKRRSAVVTFSRSGRVSLCSTGETQDVNNLTEFRAPRYGAPHSDGGREHTYIGIHACCWLRSLTT